MANILRRLCALAALLTLAAAGCGSEDDRVMVLDLSGDHFDDARREARSLGLVVERTDIGLDDVAEGMRAGTVISQDPPAGTRVAAGSTVMFTVVPDFAVVPRVLNMSEDRAVQLLSDAGLIADVTSYRSSRADPGDVYAISPRPGSIVPAGSDVRVSVAEEPLLRIRYRLELFDDSNFYGGDFACVGAGQSDNWREGNTVSLLGPSGERLASARLDSGQLEGPDEMTGRDAMCVFNVVFDDVAEVASYAVVVTGEGRDPLTFSLSRARSGVVQQYRYAADLWDPYGQ